MAGDGITRVLQHLRRAVVRRDGAGLTDGELLDTYLTRQDEGCFEALVRRHGPMVLGVCRRLLPNAEDAQDAFQATFLVLVRRAAAVFPRERVGNWLYGVAYRTALEARKLTARRRAREKQVSDMPQPTVEPEDCWRELRPLLDQELERLPEKYRTAVVLCDLEGRTRREAARQLNLPEGTLSGRLTTARRLLARRLSRRGLVLSAAALAGALSQGRASAKLTAPLLTSTVQKAARAAGGFPSPVAGLADKVVRTLAWARVKTVALLLTLVALVGTCLITWAFRPGRPAAGATAEKTPALGSMVRGSSPEERLRGTWVAVSAEFDGVKGFGMGGSANKLVFAGDRVTYWSNKGPHQGTFRLNTGHKPNEIDIVFSEGVVLRGIYELDGNRLRFCWTKGGGRPTCFDTTTGELFTFLFTYEKKPEG